MDDFTEHWIGWTFPPVERAISDSKWMADQPSDYCQRCGDSVGEGEATHEGCATCRKGAELAGGIADGVIRLGPYIDPVRGWVKAIKYHRWDDMGYALGRMLGEQVQSSGIVSSERVVVVPTPMPWQRRMYRGIDHTDLIAHALASEIDAPVARMLKRTNHAPQVSLTPSERKRAGSRGMRLARRFGGWSVRGLHIVLVDDVRTTGSTLKSAARLLKRLRPERIVCAVIGVSDNKARQLRRSRSAKDVANIQFG
jgi:ComF family protein